jgi:hypothetical protein
MTFLAKLVTTPRVTELDLVHHPQIWQRRLVTLRKVAAAVRPRKRKVDSMRPTAPSKPKARVETNQLRSLPEAS